MDYNDRNDHDLWRKKILLISLHVLNALDDLQKN